MPHVALSRVATLHEVPAHPRASRPPIPRSLLDTEAVAVLHRAARALLRELPQLTDRLVVALGEAEPSYAAAIAADPTEIWHEVHGSLRHSVGSLLGPGEARADAHLASTRIGETRAERGLPLDALLHAFRLGGALVWQGLVEETTRTHPDDIRLLVHVATDVWNFVDEHCAVAAEAYRRAERRLAWRRENRERLLLAALLDGTAKLADLADAAAVLALPEDGRYAVLALATGPLDRPRSGFDALSALPPGARVLRRSGAETEYALLPLRGAAGRAAEDRRAERGGGERDGLAQGRAGGGREAAGAEQAAPGSGGRDGEESELTSAVAALGLPPGARVGVSPVAEGLTGLPAARRLADTALRTCPRGGGAVLLDERLPDALVVSSPELAAALAERVLGPLRALEPVESGLLLDTAAVWLATGGSARHCAARLYCHRNTVLNRLRRFEQVTGRSLAHPAQAVEVSLALTARRLLELP
ncbi:PucR family transcriptional regulator [Streptomyces sp. NPDC060194]|uniref:PucR family transcriptional regulator n=1 Tax=Streptomyces sp. NPDC060194 TaxID=3347069 RepID=UPI0036540609